MKLNTYDIGTIDENKLEVAIVGIEYNGELYFENVGAEMDWEIPERNIESGENAVEAAIRIIEDEVGALSFELKPVCDYSIVENELEVSGRLFYAKVEKFDSEPKLRYFMLHPKLYDELNATKEEI